MKDSFVLFLMIVLTSSKINNDINYSSLKTFPRTISVFSFFVVVNCILLFYQKKKKILLVACFNYRAARN